MELNKSLIMKGGKELLYQVSVGQIAKQWNCDEIQFYMVKRSRIA